MKQLLTMLMLLTSTASALANDVSHIWNDDAGLVAAKGCVSFQQHGEVSNKIAELAEQVIQVTDSPATMAFEQSALPIVGSYWQAVSHDSQVAMVRCQNREYVVFDVHSPGNASLRVAARPGAALFRYVRVHTPEEAEEALTSNTSDGDGGSLVDGVVAFEGGFEQVLCGADSQTGSQIEVIDQQLKKSLFKADRGEPVKLAQSWGINKQMKKIGGENVAFVKAHFPARGGKSVGWVGENLIQPKSACVGESSEKVATSRAVWTFPTIKRTTHNYKDGQRRFKAARSGGRWHAACDLYRVKNEKAVAVYDGKVIRGLYYFYEGTYAIEIKHTGGKVVRYGEITGTAATNVSLNKTVTAGQSIGFIGKVNSGCCNPMLHFEIYAGTKTGALTQSGNKFQRRSDLLDPSAYLTEWEKAKFGVNF